MTVTTVTTRDGRALHVERHGARRPTVVFESGMGACGAWWGAVVPRVAVRATAVVYDRAGLGGSSPDPRPRTLARLAGDLVDLLDQLGDGPFVLVGHSWGGPIVRCAAAAAAERVGGLVLVDATDEGCDRFFSRVAALQTRWFLAALPALARIGALRMAVWASARALPTEAAARVRLVEGSAAHARAYRAELAPSIAELRVLAASPPPCPDVPVTVVSGTRSSRPGRGRRDALVAAHRARAASFPQGRHVSATRSGHLVPLTEPQLVADEVLRIIDLIEEEANPS